MTQPNAPTPIMDLYSLVNLSRATRPIPCRSPNLTTKFFTWQNRQFLLEKKLGSDTYLFRQAFLLWHDKRVSPSLVCLQHEVKKEFDKINNTKIVTMCNKHYVIPWGLRPLYLSRALVWKWTWSSTSKFVFKLVFVFYDSGVMGLCPLQHGTWWVSEFTIDGCSDWTVGEENPSPRLPSGT